MKSTLSDIIGTIDGIDGLCTTYGGGDYAVTVWDDMDGNYEMVFTRSTSDLAFNRVTVAPEDIEAKMGEYGPNAKDWSPVEFGSGAKLTSAEAAATLGITPAAIRKAVQYGTLRGTKRGQMWFLERGEVERYRTEHLGQRGRKSAD